MKKIIIALMAAVLALPLFTSCDKMLEEKNYGNPTTADLMTNESNVALLVGQRQSIDDTASVWIALR